MGQFMVYFCAARAGNMKRRRRPGDRGKDKKGEVVAAVMDGCVAVHKWLYAL